MWNQPLHAFRPVSERGRYHAVRLLAHAQLLHRLLPTRYNSSSSELEGEWPLPGVSAVENSTILKPARVVHSDSLAHLRINVVSSQRLHHHFHLLHGYSMNGVSRVERKWTKSAALQRQSPLRSQSQSDLPRCSRMTWISTLVPLALPHSRATKAPPSSLSSFSRSERILSSAKKSKLKGLNFFAGLGPGFSRRTGRRKPLRQGRPRGFGTED